MLELSSFQLEAGAASGFEADAAALLNLSEDHLDWHGSFAAYGAAKARVFGTRATIVVNRDDSAALALVPAPTTLAPTRKGRAPKVVARRVVTFGAGLPEKPGDWGLAVDHDMAWLARALDDGGSAHDGVLVQHLMPADALRVRGRHNALNALAALALAGILLAPMLHAAQNRRTAKFRARCPHRRRRRVRRQQGNQRRRDRRRARSVWQRARAGCSSSSWVATARGRTSRRPQRRSPSTRAC